jgi:hypothetical protein
LCCRAGAAALLASALTACGTISEQTATTAFTDPGRYDVYACQDIDRQAKDLHKRQTELEQLMARAEQGAAGTFVSSLAYRTDYLQVRGELNELNKAAAAKQCAIDSKYASGRAVF